MGRLVKCLLSCLQTSLHIKTKKQPSLLQTRGQRKWRGTRSRLCQGLWVARWCRGAQSWRVQSPQSPPDPRASRPGCSPPPRSPQGPERWLQQWGMWLRGGSCLQRKKENVREWQWWWWFLLIYSDILCSWADSLHLHVILHEWLDFYCVFLNIHRSGVLTALAWLVPHETAAVLAQVLYTPYNHAPCHFMQSHI